MVLLTLKHCVANMKVNKTFEKEVFRLNSHLLHNTS